MTETEWLSSTEPGAMLAWLRGDVAPAIQPLDARCKISECKLRLVDTALLSTMGCNIPATAFMVAHSQRSAAAGILREIIGNPFRPLTLPPSTACKVCDGVGSFLLGFGEDAERIPCQHCPWLTPTVLALAKAAYEERPGRECGMCVDGDVLHHPKGVPFSQSFASIEPCRRSGGTGRIDDGTLDPDRLAVLADALEEAGCAEASILRHLRSEPEPWVRPEGCGVMSHDLECDRCGVRLYGRSPQDACRYKPAPAGPHVRGCWALDLILGRE